MVHVIRIIRHHRCDNVYNMVDKINNKLHKMANLTDRQNSFMAVFTTIILMLALWKCIELIWWGISLLFS